MNIMDILGPVTMAVVCISLCSLFEEPNRRSFNAIVIAGAGAAYLNGGFGIWESSSWPWLPTVLTRDCAPTVS